MRLQNYVIALAILSSGCVPPPPAPYVDRWQVEREQAYRELLENIREGRIICEPC